MENLLSMAGRLTGFVGIAICAIAAIARVIGIYSIAGLWVGTLLLAGIAAIVTGCFLLLFLMSQRR